MRCLDARTRTRRAILGFRRRRRARRPFRKWPTYSNATPFWKKTKTAFLATFQLTDSNHPRLPNSNAANNPDPRGAVVFNRREIRAVARAIVSHQLQDTCDRRFPCFVGFQVGEGQCAIMVRNSQTEFKVARHIVKRVRSSRGLPRRVPCGNRK